jgi:hypothetical protein
VRLYSNLEGFDGLARVGTANEKPDYFLFADNSGVDDEKARFREPILGMPLNPRSMNALACSRQLRVFLVGSQ